MRPEPRMAPPGAMHTTAINRILRSRGIEQHKVVGSIKRIATCKWRVCGLSRDGQPLPDEVFEVRDGKMIWRTI